MSDLTSIVTEDGVTLHKGEPVWYLNYLGQIRPTVLNQRVRTTIKYFSSEDAAKAFKEKNKDIRGYGTR